MMDLTDGLNVFREDAQSWKCTLELERTSQYILGLISQYKDRPSTVALDEAKSFLIAVEKWKAMCLKERMGNACKNSRELIWQALWGAVEARRDKEALLSIMHLKGFGASTDEETGQRRAKVATSVLRFLFPDEWGVVDWRTISILAQLEQADGDVERALTQAKKFNPAELRSDLNIVDEQAAMEEIRKYRALRDLSRLPRAADVDMALFGLSLLVWPLSSNEPN